MIYREFAPSSELGRYIQCYWSLSGTEGAAGGVQPILPDGRMELVLNLGDAFRKAIEGRWERQPNAMIVGQMGRPVVVEPAGLVDIVGVRFHPWGARAFIEAPMDRFNSVLPGVDDVSTVLSRVVKDSEGELRERRTVAALERMLLSALRHRRRTDDLAESAARLIVGTRGLASVSATAREVGLTGRQLERKFLDVVGIGPKRLCRILRFQGALMASQQQSNANWAEIAARCGYFDQAHLIRDFREFSGHAPTALQLNETSLTALILAAGVDQ